MKCSKIFICLLLGIAVASCCKKNEPEIPTEPKVEIATAYYFTGIVHEGNNHIAGVDVLLNGVKKATTDKNGAYIFSVETKGSYDLTFQKNGYVPQSLTRDNSGLADQQSTVVNVRLTPMAQAVVATGDNQAINSTLPASGINVTVGLDLPKGAVAKGTNVYLTPYAPSANGTIPSLLAVDIQPSSLQFTNATLKIKGTLPAGINYSKLIVSDISAKSKAVTMSPVYDPVTNQYSIGINSFGNYVVKTNIPVIISQPETSTTVFQNFSNDAACGANDPIDITLTVTERSGFEYVTPVLNLVKNAFPALSESDQITIAKSIASKVESLLGPAGIETYKVDKGTVKVYPNTIMQYKAYAVDRYITADFEFLDSQQKSVVVSVKVKQATGVSSTITAISCENHSGGGTN